MVVNGPDSGKPRLVIVIESQGRDQEIMRFAWPAYLANARSAMNCPSAVLIVICSDPSEADECRGLISMGHPGWDLQPIVIDPSHAPDDDANPHLTLFLACLHVLDTADPVVARRVLGAIRDTGGSCADRKKLTAILLKEASVAGRETLEDLMETIDWSDDFIEAYERKGEARGLVKGRSRARLRRRWAT